MENNEEKKMRGFMVFMTLLVTLFFFSLKIPFLVSFICSLILICLLNVCWLVYGFLYKLLGGYISARDIKIRKKADK